MGILILFLFDYDPPQGKRSGILGGLKAQWSAQPRASEAAPWVCETKI